MLVPNHRFTSPLRYPGGKGMLVSFVKSVIKENQLLDGHYVEAYAGGAGIAWPLLFGEYVSNVHINDLDKHIYSFWYSVFNCTDELCRAIRNKRVTMSEWYRQRLIYLEPNNHDLLELGFSTFFLNRTNRSGIINGGVIGGKEQKGRWKLNARYNKKDLIQRIQRLARYKSRVTISCLDGAKFILRTLPKLPTNTLVYLDPPYYVKGKDLYENHFSPRDHVSLARVIQKRIHQPWIVSYDAIPEITELYKKRRTIKYSLSYSAQSRYFGREVMFFSDSLTIPDLPHPLISRCNHNKTFARSF